MIQERTLPHNLEAERSVLGAILLHTEAYNLVAATLKPSHFFREAHRRIYQAIEAAHEKPDAAIDLVLLKDTLERRGELEEVGGPVYIAALVDGVPRSMNVEHYAEIVRELAVYRETIYAANKAVADAYEADKPAPMVIADLERRLIELSQGQIEGRMTTLREATSSLLEEIEYRIAHQGELSGSETGFASINELTSGWQAGDMNIIAARPSIGKTTFAINSAIAAAQSGKRVIYFSMEMTRKQLEFRLLSCLSEVPLTRIIGGYIMSQEWEKLSNAIGAMAELPFVIDDTPGITPREIRSKVRRRKSIDGGVDIVVVDYVQIMGSDIRQRNASKREKIADNALIMQQLAKEEAFALLLLSQLSRKGQDRADPRPQLSDLRDAGELEEYADIVAFLHRKHHREGGVTNFIIEKQRNGPSGTVNLTLDRDITRFTDGGEEKAPTPEEIAAEEERRKEIRRKAGRRRAVAHVG